MLQQLFGIIQADIGQVFTKAFPRIAFEIMAEIRLTARKMLANKIGRQIQRIITLDISADRVDQGVGSMFLYLLDIGKLEHFTKWKEQYIDSFFVGKLCFELVVFLEHQIKFSIEYF